MRWLTIPLLIFFTLLVLLSASLWLFNWYIGTPQMKEAAKKCSFVPKEYEYLCYELYKEQVPAYWLPKLFD